MAATRRVAQIVAPKKFEVIEEPLGSPGPDEICLRIIAVGLCHSDMPAFLGKSSIGNHEDGSFFKDTDLKYPLRVGHEPVGVVEAVGSNVREYKEGDIISGMASPTFASHVMVNPAMAKLMKLPPEVKEPKYCLAEPLMCISNIVRAGTPSFGDYIAIIGCGMMGLLTLSGIARSAAFDVIGIDLVDSRLEWAKKLGATKTINARTQDVSSLIAQITKGHGVDIAVEITGRMAGFTLACDIIRGGGDIGGTGRGKILIPSLYGLPEVMDAGYQLMFKSPIVHSTHPWYSMDYMDDMRRGVEGFLRGIFPLDQMITHEFSLDDIQAGFEMMEHPTEDYLKGIVVP